MAKFVQPGFNIQAFNCPQCNAYARQIWETTYHVNEFNRVPHVMEGLVTACCSHCNQYSIWYYEQMIHPNLSTVPLPNQDLPPDVIEDYNEAREIFELSPRGAAALLRLAIQKLCIYLGESGKNINDDIASLVDKGLPEKVQQSMDILRVVGNNAVHPGQIDLNDNPELASSLFGLLNIIAEVMITQPKHVAQLYSQLPQNLTDAIKKRDGNP